MAREALFLCCRQTKHLQQGCHHGVLLQISRALECHASTCCNFVAEAGRSRRAYAIAILLCDMLVPGTNCIHLPSTVEVVLYCACHGHVSASVLRETCAILDGDDQPCSDTAHRGCVCLLAA